MFQSLRRLGLRSRVPGAGRLLPGMFDQVAMLRGWGTALRQRQYQRPHAILLDARLEWSVSGWQVLQPLKMDPATRSIPVIVWSGAIDQLGDKERWLAERGIPTLSKPFEIDELYETLEAAMTHKVTQLEELVWQESESGCVHFYRWALRRNPRPSAPPSPPRSLRRLATSRRREWP
jgi:CheY-like chemotaxis protein